MNKKICDFILKDEWTDLVLKCSNKGTVSSYLYKCKKIQSINQDVLKSLIINIEYKFILLPLKNLQSIYKANLKVIDYYYFQNFLMHHIF